MSLIFPFMIAVVEIGGKQHTVEQDMVIIVDRQAGDVGSIMTLPALLIASADGKTVKVGTPTVEGSQISFKIEEHLKADKIRVFKIKSKKRYMRTQGFRAYQTRLTVTAIA
jgi:large subunit ribosomal protein L21